MPAPADEATVTKVGSRLSAAAVQVEGLARHYGEREALSGVSLSLSEGQTLVVFGPNGAGKT
ncbi:MAG TPA: ABC transporter ATP-binding protein, partial [Solirubrobacteraceae bacterium]|nr:ABC transporter ATP-binding protein [Solirubrobacteraceae bacterium]